MCKEEKTSMHRSYEVLKYEGFEFYTVFDADNLDSALICLRSGRDELYATKNTRKKMNMLQYFDEIFSLSVRKKRGEGMARQRKKKEEDVKLEALKEAFEARRTALQAGESSS